MSTVASLLVRAVESHVGLGVPQPGGSPVSVTAKVKLSEPLKLGFGV